MKFFAIIACIFISAQHCTASGGTAGGVSSGGTAGKGKPATGGTAGGVSSGGTAGKGKPATGGTAGAGNKSPGEFLPVSINIWAVIGFALLESWPNLNC